MTKTIQFIASSAIDTRASTLNVLELANDTNPATQTLQGVDRIHLHFLESPVEVLGDGIRATGDVLVDQLLQMQRSGFSSAVLRADQNLFHAQRQLAHFANFYQGDATNAMPQFAAEEATA